MKKLTIILIATLILGGCEYKPIAQGSFHSEKVIIESTNADLWSGPNHSYTFLIDTTGDDVYDMTFTAYGDRFGKVISTAPKKQNIIIEHSSGGATNIRIY